MELREFLKQPMTFLGLAKKTYERIGYNENLVTIGDFLTYYEEVKNKLSKYSSTLQTYDINAINRALAPYGIIFGMSELEIMIRSEFPNSLLLQHFTAIDKLHYYEEIMINLDIKIVLDIIRRDENNLNAKTFLGHSFNENVKKALAKYGLTLGMNDEQIELYCIAELIDQKMDAVLKQYTNLDTSIILSREKTQQSFMALIEAMQWLQVLQNFKKKLQNLNNKPSDITNELASLLGRHHHG